MYGACACRFTRADGERDRVPVTAAAPDVGLCGPMEASGVTTRRRAYMCLGVGGRGGQLQCLPDDWAPSKHQKHHPQPRIISSLTERAQRLKAERGKDFLYIIEGFPDKTEEYRERGMAAGRDSPEHTHDPIPECSLMLLAADRGGTKLLVSLYAY